MKKLICLLLVLGMLITLLAACSKKKDGDGQTTDTGGGTGEVVTGEEETQYYLDTLPQNTYGENEFRIVTINGNVPKEAEVYGNEVQKSLYERDLALMDKYAVGIKYEDIPNANDAEAMEKLQRLSKGDEGIFHAYITSGKRLMSLAVKGILQDMKQIENLDMEQKWWNQSLNENCAINDKLYCSAGPYSEYYYHAAFCIAYNRAMAVDFGEKDIYGYVKNGTWTLAKMLEICTERGVTADLGEQGVWNDKDRYAISAFQPGMYGLYAGAGGKFSSVDADGNITVDLAPGTSLDIITKLGSLFASADKGGSCARFSPYNNFKTSADIFTSGRALFLYTSTGYINDYLPSTINYGILPLPKYDETQENYITCAWAESNYCLSVPANGMSEIEKAFTGLMIEAYCYLSYEIVRPVKYDRILKYQVATDADVSEVMDLLFNTLYFDANLMFDFGSDKDQGIEGTRTLVSTTIFHNTTGEYAGKYNELKPLVTAALNNLRAQSQ